MKKVFSIIFSFLIGGLFIFGSFFTSSSASSGEGGFSDTEEYGYASIYTYTGSVFRYPFSALDGAFFRTSNNVGTPGFALSGSVISYTEGNTLLTLYDPFVNYTITNPSFRIQEITNGSIYLGHEEDGTYSIYSVDSVAEFSFVANGEVMTTIILFPGYYLRFDPTKNTDLKGADLLRIVLLFEKSGNTGLEFVNPRSSQTGSPIVTRILGAIPLLGALQDYLKSHSQDQIAFNTKYERAQTMRQEPQSILFVNEEKRNYFFRLHLYNALSSITSPTLNVDDAIAEIRSIYDQSKALGLNTDVRAILEQFVIDARFVIYGTSSATDSQAYENSVTRYEKMYAAVAEILGITPKDPRTRIFQRLSDVYLDNMLNLTPTDAYYRVAQVLEGTLSVPSTDLQSKDYLDISLYAEKILIDSFRKSAETGLNTVTYPSTYTLITTLFKATKKYYNVYETERRDVAVTAFASQLYVPILSELVNGINSTYITVEDGKYLLNSAYRSMSDTSNVERGVVNGIANVIDASQDALTTFLSVKDRVGGTDIVSNYSEMEDFNNTLNIAYRIVSDYRLYLKDPSYTTIQGVSTIDETPSSTSTEVTPEAPVITTGETDTSTTNTVTDAVSSPADPSTSTDSSSSIQEYIPSSTGIEDYYPSL